MSQTPIVPHVNAEFLLWLLLESSLRPTELSRRIDGDLWVAERIAFRNPTETKPQVVLTGENPGGSQEALDALRSGKVISEISIGLRSGDHEYSATLSGSDLGIKRLKLPATLSEGDDAQVYDRAYLYEQFTGTLQRAFQAYAEDRTDARSFRRRVSDWLAVD